MIDSHVTRQLSARRIWSDHMQRMLRRLDLHERETADEILESLAVFCQHHPHMSDRNLSLLLARTFCATGDRDAAGRVLHHDRSHRSHADSWLDVLSAEYPFPDLFPLFSSHALRPLRLRSAGQDAAWVLDLGKIYLSDADRHEIILKQTLRVLIQTASNLWKKSDGQGVLVIKGLPSYSSAQIHNVNLPVSELMDYIKDILQQCAARLEWTLTPSVLLLDM